MSAKGSIHTVTRSGWADIETVNVYKLVDGGDPEFVETYKVPNEYNSETLQQDYTFAYEYTIVDEVGESVVLRFTPAGESAGISGWDEDAFEVTASVIFSVASSSISIGISV